MNRFLAFALTKFALATLIILSSESAKPAALQSPQARRLIILKVDGLNADLLYSMMHSIDPATGKSRLPWFTHIFAENGLVFENFYTRGISLSAPSWSMLDTGQHTVIRGNVEYDRYTGHVYDYLNFVPFYLSYARKHEVDMPGVEVLDRAGIPLLIDSFRYPEIYQSSQLYQRGVTWTTLRRALEHRFSTEALVSTLENTGPSMGEVLAGQTENELKAGLANPGVYYLDYFTGSVDHEGHATSDPAALLAVLRNLDALAGRIWTAAQASPLAAKTIFVVVSDHGMNNVPGVLSQTYSLPDLLNSVEGGANHVVTNRLQLTDFRLWGLDPLLSRVITASTASFYLKGQEKHYPTAWLDIDGNERVAVHLRNNALNKIHILLLQLAKPDLPSEIRRAAAAYIENTIDQHRRQWESTAAELTEELEALKQEIDTAKDEVARQPHKWTTEQHDNGLDKVARRQAYERQDWKSEYAAYSSYVAHLKRLLAWKPDGDHPLQTKISDLIPELALGDNNTVGDLQHYVIGPAESGLVLDGKGALDDERCFRHIDYFRFLASQRAKNNPQSSLSPRPIDFIAVALPRGEYDGADGSQQNAYWLYGDEENQLLILAAGEGRLLVKPASHLQQDAAGKISWQPAQWREGLPLHVWEDPQLRLPPGADRDSWLCAWHTESEWMNAIHLCRYSNGVIGITEELSPVADNVPGPPGLSPIVLRYEKRQRELVRADFHVFAADHWNFNVRFPNPGGNHGSFFRISTHSVWMIAGAGLPNRDIEEPYDSLNFASTLLNLLGRTPPMPDRVVALSP